MAAAYRRIHVHRTCSFTDRAFAQSRARALRFKNRPFPCGTFIVDKDPGLPDMFICLFPNSVVHTFMISRPARILGMHVNLLRFASSAVVFEFIPGRWSIIYTLSVTEIYGLTFMYVLWTILFISCGTCSRLSFWVCARVGWGANTQKSCWDVIRRLRSC